jgi:hypothetical protein
MTTVGWGALARAVAAETVTATSEPTATVPESSNVRRFRAAMRTGIRCSATVSEGSASTSAQFPQGTRPGIETHSTPLPC